MVNLSSPNMQMSGDGFSKAKGSSLIGNQHQFKATTLLALSTADSASVARCFMETSVYWLLLSFQNQPQKALHCIKVIDSGGRVGFLLHRLCICSSHKGLHYQYMSYARERWAISSNSLSLYLALSLTLSFTLAVSCSRSLSHIGREWFSLVTPRYVLSFEGWLILLILHEVEDQEVAGTRRFSVQAV